MIALGQDTLNTRCTLTVGGRSYDYFSLAALESAGLGDISRLPGPVDAESISTELKKRLLPETLLAYDAKAYGVDTTQTYNQWSRGQIDDLVLETYIIFPLISYEGI